MLLGALAWRADGSDTIATATATATVATLSGAMAVCHVGVAGAAPRRMTKVRWRSTEEIRAQFSRERGQE